MSHRTLLYLADEPIPAIPGVLFPGDPNATSRLEDFEIHQAYLFAADESGDVFEVNEPGHVVGAIRAGATWNPLVRRKVARLLDQFQPDALILQGPVSRIIGLPIAYSQAISIRIALTPDMAHWMTSSLLGPIIKANQYATRFVTDSFAAARRLVHQEQVDRNMIEIMAWGVDGLRFGHRTPESVTESKHRLGLSGEQPVILASGSMSHSQDYETLLFAVRQLLPHQPHVQLVIAGVRSQTPSFLGGAILRHGLEHHVILPSSDMPFESWIPAADVGVATSYVESCPPHLLLCMAAGLPCVAANVGGINELMTHGESGYLVDFKDADQLAMFITILLLSPELADRMGSASRERAQQNYSYEVAVRARDDFFRTMAYAVIG